MRDILPFKCSCRVPLESLGVKFKLISTNSVSFITGKTRLVSWHFAYDLLQDMEKKSFLGLIHITQTRWCDNKKGYLLYHHVHK